MNASVRLIPTKLAAAALAAGVVAAGSSIGAAQRAVPTIEVNVVNTSLITDALGSVGWFVDGVAGTVAIPIEAVVSLPFDALTAIAVSVQRPDFAPSVLSWLVNRYVNPSESYPYYTFPWDLKANAIGNIAYAFPYPLGPSTTQPGLINGLVDGIANAIGGALGGLPDAGNGAAATDAFWATTAGRIVTSLNNVPLAPVWAAWDVADYVGFLPYNVAATIESAIKSPQDIPGLVSNLVYGLLGSDAQGGLAGYLIHDFGYPLTTLPGPVGQLATNLVAGLQQGLENLLSNLPAPTPPNPVAATSAAGTGPVSTAAVHGVGPADVPAYNGQGSNSVTLAVPGAADVPKTDASKASDASKTVDAPKTSDTSKTVDAPKASDTSKTVDTPDASKAPDTSDTSKAPETKPDAQGNATGGDTAAAGAADKADKSAGKATSDKIKSGNKVQPGAKSAPGGAATGNTDKSAATGGADKPPASEGTDKPAGGAHSDSSGSSSGADHAGAAA